MSPARGAKGHAPGTHGGEITLPSLPPLNTTQQFATTKQPPRAHRSHAEKHFKHYVLDFLILFMAVVAGFFVDNTREHYVEVQREDQFIHSMYADLLADIHQLDSLLDRRKEKQVMIDSMLFILGSAEPGKYGSQLYYYARWMPRINRMYNNDGTLTQLKNAGNLRLIRSNAARESIMQYDQQMRF